MYFMNSPTMPGQNSSGEKAAMRVIVAAITGPAMRLGGKREGFALSHAFAHPPLGELGDDDGVVDQHADRQDQAEQDDDVHRQPEQASPSMPIRNETGIAMPMKIEARPTGRTG